MKIKITSPLVNQAFEIDIVNTDLETQKKYLAEIAQLIATLSSLESMYNVGGMPSNKVADVVEEKKTEQVKSEMVVEKKRRYITSRTPTSEYNPEHCYVELAADLTHYKSSEIDYYINKVVDAFAKAFPGMTIKLAEKYIHHMRNGTEIAVTHVQNYSEESTVKTLLSMSNTFRVYVNDYVSPQTEEVKTTETTPAQGQEKFVDRYYLTLDNFEYAKYRDEDCYLELQPTKSPMEEEESIKIFMDAYSNISRELTIKLFTFLKDGMKNDPNFLGLNMYELQKHSAYRSRYTLINNPKYFRIYAKSNFAKGGNH